MSGEIRGQLAGARIGVAGWKRRRTIAHGIEATTMELILDGADDCFILCLEPVIPLYGSAARSEVLWNDECCRQNEQYDR